MEIAKNKVLMGIYAGAGGLDAQDWASMLLRMYQRYAQKKNWAFVVLYDSTGEQGGIKTASIEITGPDVYEKLKQENGVHRLVRISPFSAKQLRHTSFALVEIMPEIQLQDIKFEPKDLRIDTFRSSGPGGQNVNKLETAVRITHIPTGLAVAVQSERSQAQNREKAMQLLYGKLLKKVDEKKAKEISDLKAEPGTIEWGSQIRSYVLHPYQMVKDHRTGVKVSQPDRILDGDLDKLIQ